MTLYNTVYPYILRHSCFFIDEIIIRIIFICVNKIYLFISRYYSCGLLANFTYQYRHCQNVNNENKMLKYFVRKFSLSTVYMFYLYIIHSCFVIDSLIVFKGPVVDKAFNLLVFAQ